VFVHDLHTGTTELVSIATDGARGNVGSSQPSISGDGRYVAFVSTATTLVERDTNNVDDVFVHDRDTGETVRIGGGDGPSYNPVISDDGAYVAFISDASNLVRDNENNPPNVFIAPREGRGVELVSVSVPIGEVIYNSSWGYDHVALTRDGRAVVFTSNNDFLVGENIEGNWHVFLRDLDRAVTEQMSLPVNANCSYCSGATSASVSGNGRYVVFEANYPQMLRDEVAQDTQLYMYDRAEGAAMRVSVATDGSMINDSVQDGVIARDGGFIAYRTEANNIVPGDLNGFPDIFVYDRNTRTTELVSARRAE
jgi:Tol biopolymer transport system component